MIHVTSIYFIVISNPLRGARLPADVDDELYSIVRVKHDLELHTRSPRSPLMMLLLASSLLLFVSHIELINILEGCGPLTRKVKAIFRLLQL